jgi:hypothetical protein
MSHSPASRSHPLRRPSAGHEIGPDAPFPTPAPVANGRTPGWPPGAALGAEPQHTLRTAHAPTRSRHRTPRLRHNPNTDQIDRPRPPLLQRGWTREAENGTVTHGGCVLRCAHHEGPGLITRAFTFSDTSASTASPPTLAMTTRIAHHEGVFVRSQRIGTGDDTGVRRDLPR